MIRPATPADTVALCAVINDAAQAYRGVIPDDCWHEPYMPLATLERELADGITFLCALEGETVQGVMGVQDKGAVRLIRHAYVRSDQRGRGIGSCLLQRLLGDGEQPTLIGTWRAAHWAINFYVKHGFRVVDDARAAQLLETWWRVPARQRATSVVLADARCYLPGALLEAAQGR